MSGWPARAFGAVAWVAVVAVGAVLVWLVISRAGAGLVADAGPVTTPTQTPAGAGSTTPPAPGAGQRASWQGESGVVTAVCRDGAIALVGAQPEDGAVVHVKDQGPDQLVVAFDGDDEGPVTVVATCRDGRPRFVETVGQAEPSPGSTATSDGADDHGGDTGGHGADDDPSGDD